MIFNWEEDFSISVKIENNAVLISANKAGLLSLANHLTALAQEVAEDHFHLDKYNSLEDNSVELIIEKIDAVK